jgi:hypothetical protein
MEHKPGICMMFFAALAKAKINVLKIFSGSDHKLAVAVAPEDLSTAVHALYAEFFPKKRSYERVSHRISKKPRKKHHSSSRCR